MELKNKPGARLRGNSWDAKHLDNFLSSYWGKKLFRQNKNTDKLRLATVKNSVPDYFEKTASKLNYEPKHQAEFFQICSRLLDIEQEVNRKEEFKLMTPMKRRESFESEKSLKEEYRRLKNNRLNIIKRERVYRNDRTQIYQRKSEPNRQEVLVRYSKSSHDVYNGYSSTKSNKPLKNIQIFEDNIAQIFKPETPNIKLHRSKRMIGVSKRPFNIISGIQNSSYIN